jgi:cyclohexanecarboxylate-CoA ligase
MQATRPPDDRRARHEARGEWPQPSLWTMLANRVAHTPDRVYMIEGAAAAAGATHRELAEHATSMAGALARLGVRAGDVVSWQLPNWFEGAALAAAIDRLGAVSNPIITIYREREVGVVCRQARSRVLVVPGLVRGVDHREIARAVRAAAPDLEHVLTVRAEPGSGMQALEALEGPGAGPATPPGPHDVSMLFYTSGTTADPKGVLHTPSTLGAIVRFHAELMHPTPDDRSILQFPLPHIGGLVMFVMLPTAHGSSTVFMDGFDPELALDVIEAEQVTSAGGPPAVLQAMFAAKNFSPAKVRSVRGSGSGAADVSPELMRETRDRFAGAVVHRSYGMTECPMFTSGGPGDPEEKRFGTDGRPVPGCVARIVDEAGGRSGRTSRARSRRTAAALRRLSRPGAERGLHGGRLHPHRRPRGHGRGRVRPHHGPAEGHHHPEGREPLREGDRG